MRGAKASAIVLVALGPLACLEDFAASQAMSTVIAWNGLLAYKGYMADVLYGFHFELQFFGWAINSKLVSDLTAS